jgi:hypothetical protein
LTLERKGSETFEGWRGILWLPGRVGCHNLQGLRAGLCPRGGETAIDGFSIGDNLPVPVASRTVPGDPIRKRVFLSHDTRARLVSEPPTPEGLMPLPVTGEYTPKKFPLVCLLADRAIIFLVAHGRLLRIDPLHLFGERDPTGRHVFECALYGRVLCLRRAVFGLGCSLSIPVRP